jgi:hypothetical protein
VPDADGVLVLAAVLVPRRDGEILGVQLAVTAEDALAVAEPVGELEAVLLAVVEADAVAVSLADAVGDGVGTVLAQTRT